MKKRYWALLALILGVGVFFRFYMIGQMPGGVFPDEAAEGLDAQNILHGFLRPFYERGNGREGLFYYLIAPIIHFFGSGYWQLHIVAAIIGVLSLVGIFLFTSRLFDAKTALLATFLMAVSTWHIVLSRTSFRAILIPLFVSFSFYFLLRVVQAQTRRERYWSAIFVGIFLAGGFYTYIAYRIMVAILAIIVALLLIADKKQHWFWIKEYWRSVVAALIALVIIFAPLGYYFISHPGSFVGRAGQVSIFNPELNNGHVGATFVSVFEKSVKAYFANGDLNWRSNISGLPFLSPLVSPFFGLALLVITLLAAWYIIQTFRGRQNVDHLKYLILAGLFWGMLMPVVTTAEGIPHGLRSIGTIPAVFIIAAVGLMYFARKVLAVWHHKWIGWLYGLVAVLYFATLIFLSYVQYFVVAYNSPDNFYAFRSDLSAVSTYLNQNPDKFHNYLVLDLFSEQTTQFMSNQTSPYVIVDPASSYKLHVGPNDRVIFAGSTLPDEQKFMQTHSAIITKSIINRFGSFDMLVLQAKQGPEGGAQNPSLAVNSDGSFWVLNLGNTIYWNWKNQSLNPWTIKIWQCVDQDCASPQLMKQNNQNDYLQPSDYVQMDGTKKDLFFKAQGFAPDRTLIKDFGITKVPLYK